jgi:alpha-tubulin suppressor-like RCC1 family protein
MKGIVASFLLSLAACGVHAAVPQIATSDTHTLALKADGSLWAWGANWSGLLGDGSTVDRLSPELIGTGYSKISAGRFASFAIKTDGTLWAWGLNSEVPAASYAGMLGDGTTTDQLTPVQTGNDFAEVVAGWFGGAAIKRDGTLWTWGQNGSIGMLGDGDPTPHIALTPRQIASGFVQVAGSQAHFLALKADGSLWAWGANDSGQLGDGTFENRATPTYIDSGFVTVTAGEYFSLGIKTDGSLWAWGTHAYGQLGLGLAGTAKDPDATVATMYYPRPTLVGQDFVAVTTGSYHTHAIKRDGSLWGWGMAAWGAVGDGLPDTDADGTGRIVPVPTQIGTGYWKTTNGGGNNNGFALKPDGSLWAWGWNGPIGMLGDGTTEDRLAPVNIGFNVLPSEGLAAGGIAYGTVERKTLQANISPNRQDGGQSACFFIIAALPGSKDMAALTAAGWETYQSATGSAFKCATAETVEVPLVVDADLSGLTGTEIYLGYGLGTTPEQSWADMLARGLWQFGYRVQ